MSTIQEQAIPLFEEIVNGYNSRRSGVAESAELRRARQSAFEKFRLVGFPTIRHEDWKYTNLNKFLKEEYTVAADGSAVGAEGAIGAPAVQLPAAAAIPGLDAYRVVLVNGVWDGVVVGGPLPKGLELKRVAEALQDPAFSGYFENGKWGNHAFPNLNTALFTDGLLLRVNGAIGKPLHIVHYYTAERNLLVQPRHLWVVEANAEVTVVETVHSVSGEVSMLVNGLTEVIVQPDARVDHLVIQAAEAGVRLVNHTTVRQKKKSLYNNYTFTFPGAELIRNDLQLRLEEDHTETHLYGLYLTAGQQLVDNHTLVDHQKPNCFSNELYKGVLLERSTGVFNGKVYVHQDAQKTNAFQQNNNLVISKHATIDSKPELEIFADDVKCSHGSTVGQFNEDALFYLRARGIGEEMAKALLITAFAFDVTEKVKVKVMEDYINHLINQHIPVNNE
ncbi:MAG TPA: Fe-S cluster assembly protein SufD [Puia sp.]|jgi:Fe-S cluster assembly protein SufD|nr:Fe-S cluster assembly protein SufD [Puia sp.]